MNNIHRLLVLFIALILCSTVYAKGKTAEIKSATVDGSASTNVSAGATITAQVILKRSTEWQTTKWIIKDSGGATISSQCHTNSKQKSQKTSFDITAPSIEDTYSISFIAYKDNKCNQGNSNTYTLSNAIIVAESAITIQLLLHMDESSWAGASNEVIDSSGNNYSGTARNGANTSSSNPAITGSPGSCRFGSFDGINDYITIDNLSDQLSGTASLSFWVRTTQTGNNTAWQAPGVTGIEQSGGVNDIFWGWLDASGHIGITVGNDNSSKSTIAVNDGIFHHIVLSRNASTGHYKIYIDGALNKSGTIATGIIGTEYSSIGRIENTSGSSEYFSGDLDEVQIFDNELSLSEVQSLMAEIHYCPATATPTPENCSTLPSDDAIYTKGTLTFWSPITVNGNALSSTGSYSPQVAIDTSGQLTTNQNITLPDLVPANFPDNSSSQNENPNSDVTYTSNTDVYYNNITLNYANKTASFEGGGPFHINLLKPNSSNVTINLAAGTYYINNLTMNGTQSKINITSGPVYLHIGNKLNPNSNKANINPSGNVKDLIVYLHNNATFTSNAQNSIFTGFIYGPQAGDITIGANITFNGAIVNGQGNITINANNFSLNYTSADKTAISAISGNCATEIDHFEFSYSKNGLTCLNSAITLKACANADCSSLYTDSFDITLTPTNSWQTPSVTVSNGTAELALQEFSAGTTALITPNSSVSPQNNLKCYADNVLDANCEINFSEAGFIFEVPTLTSCKPEADVVIKAVKMSEESTQCVGALTGQQTVNFVSTLVSPATGTKKPLIAGSEINTSASGTDLNLTFDVNGEATFTAQYDDAGKLQLDALYTDNNGLELAGTDQFVVRPMAIATYSTDSIAECASNDASCSKFKKAGEEFDLIVKAACWTADNDTDYSDNPATPNFILNSVKATQTLIAPSTGVNGSLLLDSFNFVAGDAGIHTLSQAISEVGVFTFSTNPPSYFDESLTTASSSSIGRFYPDHFELTTLSNGSFGTNACTGFSYSGQSFNYQTSPQLTVTAYSALSPATITQNYTGAFAQLTSTDFTITTPTTDATQFGVDATNRVRLLWTPDAPSLTDNTDGTLTFAFGNDSYSYLHESNSLIDEFSNTVDLTFTAISDSDSVAAQDVPYTLQPSGETIRFGRFAISSIHGSELAPLAVTLSTEYFNGVNWVDNTADQCTTIALASALQLANPETASGSWQTGNSTMTIANGTTSGTLTNNVPLLNGQATLTLSAPGEDNEGYVDIRSQLSLTNAWLLGDYDSDGNYDDEATGRASFGLFKGSDNIIFRRELY